MSADTELLRPRTVTYTLSGKIGCFSSVSWLFNDPSHIFTDPTPKMMFRGLMSQGGRSIMRSRWVWLTILWQILLCFSAYTSWDHMAQSDCLGQIQHPISGQNQEVPQLMQLEYTNLKNVTKVLWALKMGFKFWTHWQGEILGLG